MTLKKNRTVLFFMLLVSVFLPACEKGELPVIPHEPGNVQTHTIALGPDYGNQVFFSLDGDEVISTNLKTAWDLAFECGDAGWRIRLNTSKGMAVAHFNQEPAVVTDTSGAQWAWDAHSGNGDSTAFGDWQAAGGTFVVNRGYDAAGLHQGFSKLNVIGVNATAYEIACADLAETTVQETTIHKDNLFGYSYFSFSGGTQVAIAPATNQWDLLFTQYTHVFEGPTPYLVTGVLINPYLTAVAVITDRPFGDLAYEDVTALQFSSRWDAIGYNWKYFNFDAGAYEVDADQVFVIRTQSGYYYKMHFTGFYNESGVKGYPKMEVERL